MKNVLVTMSGGTTTVINATLAGIIQANNETRAFDNICFGSPGIEGFLGRQIKKISTLSEDNLIRLKNTPGSAVVGTTRIGELQHSDCKLFEQICNENSISAFINIGGNGTIQQTRVMANSISKEISLACAPKTVDNDLGDIECKKVFFTPGFPSCVNHWSYIAQLLNIENIGACSHDKVLIAQTFGRKTGFIAGCVRLIDPDRKLPLLLLLPEDQQPLSAVIGAIEDLLLKHDRALVVMSEGYEVMNIGAVHDKAGQVMYGTSRTTSAQQLVTNLLNHGIQARSYIPTVLQRQSDMLTLDFDRMVAFDVGAHTLRELADGAHEFLASISKHDSYDTANRYGAAIKSISFQECHSFSRALHSDFIKKGRFDVSDAYLEYLGDIISISSKENTFWGINVVDNFLTEL